MTRGLVTLTYLLIAGFLAGLSSYHTGAWAVLFAVGSIATGIRCGVWLKDGEVQVWEARARHMATEFQLLLEERAARVKLPRHERDLFEAWLRTGSIQGTAHRLGIPINTVKHRIKRLLKRTGAKSLGDLARLMVWGRDGLRWASPDDVQPSGESTTVTVHFTEPMAEAAIGRDAERARRGGK